MEPQTPFLPADVQYLLGQYSGVALPLSRLNADSRAYTSEQYLTVLCKKPISLSEITKYSQKAPREIFGIFTFADNTFEGNIYDGGYYGDYTKIQQIIFTLIEGKYAEYNAFTAMDAISPVRDIIEARGLKPEDYYFTKLRSYSGNISDVTYYKIAEAVKDGGSANLPNLELNLAAQYRIYQDRVGCVARDPNYALSTIIGKIKYLQQELRGQNLFVVACTYYRLWVESSIVKMLKGTLEQEYIYLGSIALDKDFRPLRDIDTTEVFKQGDQMAEYLINYFNKIATISP